MLPFRDFSVSGRFNLPFCPNIAPESMSLPSRRLSSLPASWRQHARTEVTPDFFPFVSHHPPLPPFDECQKSQAFRTRSFLLCRFQSLAARQEMCWWNASIMSLQYVLLTMLSAGNCGDIGLGWGGDGWTKSILSFNFKPPAFYFVNCSNKELLQKAVC